MQDSRDHNALPVLSIEDDMPAAFHAVQAGSNVTTRAAGCWVFGEHPATGFKIVKVTDGLILTPGFERIASDIQQVALGAARKTNLSHGLPRGLGKTKGSPNTGKHIPLGHAAGIAFVDCGA